MPGDLCGCGQPADFTHICGINPPVTIGSARTPPLDADDDPDLFDYINASDIIIVREDNER